MQQQQQFGCYSKPLSASDKNKIATIVTLFAESGKSAEYVEAAAQLSADATPHLQTAIQRHMTSLHAQELQHQM